MCDADNIRVRDDYIEWITTQISLIIQNNRSIQEDVIDAFRTCSIHDHDDLQSFVEVTLLHMPIRQQYGFNVYVCDEGVFTDRDMSLVDWRELYDECMNTIKDIDNGEM